jgi:cytidine deaminase
MDIPRKVDFMTPEERDRLLEAAREAATHAYAPYSGFRVGSAVLTSSGGVYIGANVENASYGLSICAERVALAAARVAGESVIRGIAIACVDRATEERVEESAPCGACRQWIQELAIDAEILLAGHDGGFRIEQLLPLAFRLSNRARR